MKKLKIFVAVLLSVCTWLALCLFVGCKDFELSTPTNIEVDINHKLTWDEVADARSYVVEIKDANGEIVDSKKEKREYSSLKSLAVGKYTIRIKAVGAQDGVESDWSTALEFDRPYETGCVYTLVNNSEYHITNAGSASGDIVIEDFYRNKPVTAIADNAFKGNGRITSIVLGNQVKSIGKNAFYRCESLTSISIPDSVTTIGPQAFQRCVSLTEISIPDNVTTINEFTFAYCRALKKVEFGKNVQYVGESAFSDCSEMTTYELPESLAYIGQYAFAANSKLTSVKIGKNVQQIGDFAFQLCTALNKLEFATDSKLSYIGQRTFYGDVELTSVMFPANLTKIDNQAFLGCSKLATVNMPSALSSLGSEVFKSTAIVNQQVEAEAEVYYVGNWIVGCDAEALYNTVEVIATAENTTYKKTLIISPNTVGIAAYAFSSFETLKIVEMPTAVKYIGAYAFAICKELSRVIIPGSVSIGAYSFVFCTNLTTFAQCTNLETIGDYAFYGCSRMNRFNNQAALPKLQKIGMYAFKGTGIWNSASNTEFPTTTQVHTGVYNNVVYICNWIVGATAGITELQINPNTVGISDFAFFENVRLSSANISGLNLKYIGTGAFYNCTSLMNVQFGANLSRIEDYTFYNCSKLSFLGGFLNNLESIGRSAFYGCSSLLTLDLSIATDFQSIGQYAFYGCSSLKTVDLGNTIKTLSNYAFYQCSSLTEIVLPDSLQAVGNRAFYKNTALESVTFGNGLLSIGQYAFSGCESLKEIRLPDTLRYIDNSAFYKCTAVENVELGNSLQYIGSYAFYGISGVTQLQLPATVEYIGSYAFKGWNGLKSILINGDIAFVGDHAFYGCKQATIYTSAIMPESNSEEVTVFWSEKFNSSHRPVVWGCTLSADKTYVESVTITKTTFSNNTVATVFTAPEREGYTFLGWAVAQGGSVVYSASDIHKAGVGSILYAVWDVVESNIEPQA